MKQLICIAAALCLSACAHDHKTNAEREEKAREHEHSGLIELADEQAERFGVKVDTVRPGEFSTVFPASGIIERTSANAATASAPISGIVRMASASNVGMPVTRGALIATIDPTAVSGGDGNRAAKAALDAARREVERLTPLYNDRLVTATDYNAAVAAYEEAKAAYAPSASNGRVLAPTGGLITSLATSNGAYVQAGDPIATITTDEMLTLHAEVSPTLYGQLAGVTDARIGDFTLSEHGGKKTGISSEKGYACIYFTFNNDGAIAPGEGVSVKLLGATRSDVISVPVDALSEQQGEYYVYIRHSPGHYEKVRVTTGHSDGRRIEIIAGLHGGEPVVTASAMTVRLAESSGKVPEGHSHQH